LLSLRGRTSEACISLQRRKLAFNRKRIPAAAATKKARFHSYFTYEKRLRARKDSNLRPTD
jgi:hypothetical protein